MIEILYIYFSWLGPELSSVVLYCILYLFGRPSVT